MLKASSLAAARPLSSPRIYLVRMTVFLILCGFLVLILYKQLLAAFFGNPGLNALILGLLAVGILLASRQVFRLFREVRWVNYASGASPNALARPPRLLAPVASLIGDADTRARLSVATTRSLLDSISARLDENRELVRYLAGLLVFLGLLGTFWGLIETVNSVAGIIGSLRTGGEAGTMFDELKTSLARPLAGMGISFSASLFGLAGSLVLGFLDLQAGQAQSRFYTELEDWLAVAAEAEAATSGGAALGAPPPELSPDLAAALNRLADAIRQGPTSLETTQSVSTLADGVEKMVEHLRAEQQAVRHWMDGQTSRDRELKAMIEKLGRERVA